MRIKLIIVLLAVTISMLIGFGLTYLYGQFFQHDRYWEGTIARVEKTQSTLLENFVTKSSFSNFESDDWSDLFSALEGKMLVEVYDQGRPLYNNAPSWKANKRNEVIAYSLDGKEVRVYSFQAPTWNSSVVRWLRNPRDWFTYKYDFITIPFVSFTLVIMLFLFLVVVLMVNRYLQDDVLRSLQMLKDDRDEL